MRDTLVAVGLTLSLVVLATGFQLRESSKAAMGITRTAFRVLRDTSATLEQKERACQQCSLKLFGVGMRFVAVGGIPTLGLLGLQHLGWISVQRVATVALSYQFVGSAFATAFAGLLLLRHVSGVPRDDVTPTSRYGKMDRALHRIAFSNERVQATMAHLEAEVFRQRLSEVELGPPVFVTSLPRAGTTLLLNMLSSVPGFATHTYRDMPFPMAPLLWASFARRYRTTEPAVERAHADGITITEDSPEAFEEVVWRSLWPQNYTAEGRFQLWSDPASVPDTLAGTFVQHMRAVVLARGVGAHRYLSKNNNNILRIPLLRKLHPNAVVLVPFRDPLEQSLSLLRQHLHFISIHKQDRFAARYMRDIGHYEFGVNLRRVDFRRCSLEAWPAPETLRFWLQYWLEAYSHIHELRDEVELISFQRLLADPTSSLQDVATALALDLASRETLLNQVCRVKSTPEQSDLGGAPSGLPATLLDEAYQLHSRLLRSCLNAPPNGPRLKMPF